MPHYIYICPIKIIYTVYDAPGCFCMWEISNGPNEPQNGDAVPGEAERNWAIKKRPGEKSPRFFVVKMNLSYLVWAVFQAE